MVKKKITEAVTGNDPQSKRWKATFAAARMAYETGEFRQAQSLLARAHELALTMPESSFAVNATDIGGAAILLGMRKPAEAAKRLEKSIVNLQGYSDHEHQELLAVALRFHAQALAEMGDERSAEKELQKSAEILEKLGPDAAVQLSFTLCDLCALYLVSGRASEAEAPIIKAMKIASNVLGPESPEYTRADMIYQLCAPMVYDSQMEQASIGIRRMEYAFGGKHPNITRALDSYFKVLAEKGDHAKIEEAKEKFGAKFAVAK